MSCLSPRNFFVKIGFISFCIIPFRFVSVNFISIYFVSHRFRFVSVNFVSFRWISFRLVSLRFGIFRFAFRFVVYRYPVCTHCNMNLFFGLLQIISTMITRKLVVYIIRAYERGVQPAVHRSWHGEPRCELLKGPISLTI